MACVCGCIYIYIRARLTYLLLQNGGLHLRFPPPGHTRPMFGHPEVQRCSSRASHPPPDGRMTHDHHQVCLAYGMRAVIITCLHYAMCVFCTVLAHMRGHITPSQAYLAHAQGTECVPYLLQPDTGEWKLFFEIHELCLEPSGLVNEAKFVTTWNQWVEEMIRGDRPPLTIRRIDPNTYRVLVKRLQLRTARITTLAPHSAALENLRSAQSAGLFCSVIVVMLIVCACIVCPVHICIYIMYVCMYIYLYKYISSSLYLHI